MAVYFAPIARLLGDLVVSLPPLQQLIEQDEDVCLILRSPAQEGLAQRIKGLKQIIRESDYLKLPPHQRLPFFNLRDHPLQKEHVWGSPEFLRDYPGYRIKDIIRYICADLGIADGQDKLEPLEAFERTDCTGKVVLIPGTAGPIKRWTNSNWLGLHRELAEMGIPSVMIGEPRENSQIVSLMKSGISWVPTRTLADALDAISSSVGVVAVDTGLMHLAVHQGIKTVAVFRQNTMFLREYSHVRYLIANNCSPECKAMEFEFAPNADVVFNDWKHSKVFEYWSQLKCRMEEDAGCMASLGTSQVIAEMKIVGII